MEYKFNFTEAECQTIANGLGKLPAEQSFNLLNKLLGGMNSQNAEAALAATRNKEPEEAK